MDDIYWTGYKVAFIAIFIGAWWYCAVHYGFLLGVGLGWLPSLLLAEIASFFWPIAVALGGFYLLVVAGRS